MRIKNVDLKHNQDIKDFMYKWERVKYGIRILITHTDLDGVGCAVLATWSAQDQEKVMQYRNDLQDDEGRYLIFADYDNIEEKLDNLSIFPHRQYFILMTDISVPYEKIQRFAEAQNVSMCILDHHPTCPDYPNTENFMCVKDTRYCATTILYRYIYITKESYVLNGFVDAINKWDTGNWGNWKKDDEVSDDIKLQMLYSTLHSKYDKKYYKIYEDMLIYIKASHKIAKQVYQSLKPIRKVYNKLNEAITEITHRSIGKGVLITMPNVMKYFSIVSKEFLNENIGYYYTVCIDNGDISMRGSDLHDVDLGAFCKKYGGGGHKKAAGIPKKTLQEVGFHIK